MIYVVIKRASNNTAARCAGPILVHPSPFQFIPNALLRNRLSRRMDAHKSTDCSASLHEQRAGRDFACLLSAPRLKCWSWVRTATQGLCVLRAWRQQVPHKSCAGWVVALKTWLLCIPSSSAVHCSNL